MHNLVHAKIYYLFRISVVRSRKKNILVARYKEEKKKNTARSCVRFVFIDE